MSITDLLLLSFVKSLSYYLLLLLTYMYLPKLVANTNLLLSLVESLRISPCLSLIFVTLISMLAVSICVSSTCGMLHENEHSNGQRQLNVIYTNKHNQEGCESFTNRDKHYNRCQFKPTQTCSCRPSCLQNIN